MTTLTRSLNDVLRDIARCSNVSVCSSMNHPCHKIVHYQTHEGIIPFQLPEPWSGDLKNAPILFISSNPSISAVELFPNAKWPDNKIKDFFTNRFLDRGPINSWVYQNKFKLLKDGRSSSVKYWSSIRNRASELLGREAVPGTDYCVTELVHCKSKSEYGVKEAIHECANKFLTEIISLSNAKVIVLVGAFARNYATAISGLTGVKVLTIPAPNSFGPKTFASFYDEIELDQIRASLVNN